MQKFWHVLASGALVAVTYGTPAVKMAAASNPVAAIAAMAGWAILGNLLEPPVDWLKRKAKS